jgi:anti-sigma-K factor RskA
MDYSRPALADRLAAAYAMGTLRGGARRRMEALLPAHPQLRHAVTLWEERLVLLVDQRLAVEPSPKVWARIEQQLFATTASASAANPVPWWRSLTVWRTWSAIATVASVGVMTLALSLAQRTPEAAAPIIVVLQANQDAGALNASFVASVSSDGRALVLKPIGDVKLDVGRVLELWAVPPQGAPRSLGLVRGDTTTKLLRARLLSDTAAFAVSVEPEGGSPTGAPTGPIVSVGKLQI